MITRLIPAGYKVLVEPDPIEEETSGGIVLVKETVDADKFSTTTGTLVAVGEQAWTGFGDGSHWAKVGDRVQYVKYANVRIPDPDNPKKEYLLLNDNDILCVVANKLEEVAK